MFYTHPFEISPTAETLIVFEHANNHLLFDQIKHL